MQLLPCRKTLLALMSGVFVSLSAFASDASHGHEEHAGKTWTDPASGIEFVYVPHGCFEMGSAKGEEAERPVHQVCIAKGFWLSRHEITQSQYQAVMGSNPSKFKGEQNPVDSVSWNDMQAFLAKLNAETHEHFALPTESQWEYACKAGGQHPIYCGMGGAESLAWGLDNAKDATHPVGEKFSNHWGLYDMSGNVQEWVADCYSSSYEWAPGDGSARDWEGCGMRVLRGGSWQYDGHYLRSTARYYSPLDSKADDVGFRILKAAN